LKRKIVPAQFLSGEIQIPGDKSISHRGLFLGGIARGKTHLENFLPSGDTFATESCLRSLGVDIQAPTPMSRVILGNGWDGLKEPADVLDAKNSGTTLRFLLGLLAGQSFFAVLTGDESLRRRPMKRVVDPLLKMGASISGRQNGNLAPLCIYGRKLNRINYLIPVASAQVKTALILAALQTEGQTVLEELMQTRDHTEKLVKCMGGEIEIVNGKISITRSSLKGIDFHIPGDFSSAAFLIAAGLCTPNSKIRIKRVGLNPTRTAFLNVLQRMGGEIGVVPFKDLNLETLGEPEGDLIITSSSLKATEILPEEVPNLIDELPVFAVAASQAEGVSKVTHAEELRVKETDRIRDLCLELRKMGVKIRELTDGFIIEGPCQLKGAEVSSHGDHRLAMALTTAGLFADGETTLDGAEAADISFPGFWNLLDQLLGKSNTK
jgi:3-phosphoshikimate 1-carboxyvinyltransferase